jgi:hypothetical protein
LAQYAVDHRTRDVVDVDYVRMASSVKGLCGAENQRKKNW